MLGKHSVFWLVDFTLKIQKCNKNTNYFILFTKKDDHEETMLFEIQFKMLPFQTYLLVYKTICFQIMTRVSFEGKMLYKYLGPDHV